MAAATHFIQTGTRVTAGAAIAGIELRVRAVAATRHRSASLLACGAPAGNRRGNRWQRDITQVPWHTPAAAAYFSFIARVTACSAVERIRIQIRAEPVAAGNDALDRSPRTISAAPHVARRGTPRSRRARAIAIMDARLVGGEICIPSGSGHGAAPSSASSPVYVGRELRDQERKFVRDIDPHKIFFRHVGLATLVAKNHLHDLAWPAQWRCANIHRAQR